MKRINIKVDGCFWKQDQCPTKASFSLPDNIESVVGTEGDNFYTGTIFKLAENSYSYIAVVPLLNNIFIGDNLYAQLQGFLGAADVEQYLDLNLIKEELNIYNNRFEKSRLDLTADFRKLFLNLDDIYDYDLSVPIPDQKLLDAITRVWQNTSIDNSPNPALNATYKKGDQITVSDQYSAYRTVFEASYGKTFVSNNVWPGRHNETYFCAWQGVGFTTAASASADILEKATDCFVAQCDQFKSIFWDQSLSNEYINGLQDQQKELDAQIKDLEDAKGQAEDNLTDAQENLQTVTEESNALIAKANDEYEDCIAKCEGDPACIAKCAAVRDAEIAAAQAAIDKAQAAVNAAQEALDDIEAALSVLNDQLQALQESISKAEQEVQAINELCDEESAGARSGAAPAIPGDAFDLLTSSGPNEMFEIWMKNQMDSKPLAAEIQKAVASAIGIDGQLSFVEQDGKRYARIKQTYLNEPQVMTSAKVIKETISAGQA
jgi:hypothetical protein